MSENSAAFADCSIRSLENLFYRYMGDNGYKYIHNLTQFVTTPNSRSNCSIDLIPKKVKNPTFCPFCTANYYENLKNPKFKIGDRARISKCDSPFRKGYRPQITKEVFQVIVFFFQKTSNIYNKG